MPCTNAGCKPSRRGHGVPRARGALSADAVRSGWLLIEDASIPGRTDDNLVEVDHVLPIFHARGVAVQTARRWATHPLAPAVVLLAVTRVLEPLRTRAPAHAASKVRIAKAQRHQATASIDDAVILFQVDVACSRHAWVPGDDRDGRAPGIRPHERSARLLDLGEQLNCVAEIDLPGPWVVLPRVTNCPPSDAADRDTRGRSSDAGQELATGDS